MGNQASLFGEAGSPPNAQLSALIKSIRLRRTEDAVLWLVSLWHGGGDHRARAQRRVLISAGEDCLSIPVMQLVSEWYNSQARFDLNAAVTEVVRIVRTPNWYATNAGRHFVRQWWEAETIENLQLGKSADCLLSVIEHAIRNRMLLQAMHAFSAFYKQPNPNRWMLAQLFNRLALESDNRPALPLAELFESNIRHLWNDQNYSGYALYVLIAGVVGEQTDPTVTVHEARQLIAQTSHLLSSGVTVPSWALDGIHVAGNDPRFSGDIRHMKVACDAFERLGRLHVEDDWTSLLASS